MAVYRRINTLLSITAAGLFILISFFVQRKNSPSKSLKNHEIVDFRNPPPCVDVLRESIRLNELLAYTQFSCKEKISVPNELHAFQLCLDAKIGVNLDEKLFFLSISNSFDDFEFETDLLKISNGSGLIVSPKTQDVYSKTKIFSNTKIKHYPGILIPSNSLDKNDESRKFIIPEDIKKQLSKNSQVKKIDILKLDCTNCWQLSDNPKLVNELIDLKLLDSVQQLHIVVRLQGNIDNLLYPWYQTFHKLYYGAKFALYSAVQLGECGRVLMHCQYKLSFVKMPPDGSANIMAPVNGMGFPDDEIDRVLSYISSHLQLCNLVNFKIGKKSWTICNLNMGDHQECIVYYFTYSGGFSRNFGYENNCQLHIFDPTLDHEVFTTPFHNIHFHNLTLADKKSGHSAPGLWPDSNEWPLSTLSQVITQFNHKKIDILILDLNGGEWDVFEEFLSQSLSKLFKHLVISLRVWFGEENENYRQLYSWFIRLEDAGWNLVDSRLNAPSDCDNYVNNNCVKTSCYVLNWVYNL